MPCVIEASIASTFHKLCPMWDDRSPQGARTMYRMASMVAARCLWWPDSFRLELTLAEDVGKLGASCAMWRYGKQ